jgi:hypothetical protein
MTASPASVPRPHRSLLAIGVSLLFLTGCQSGSVDPESSSGSVSGAYASPDPRSTADTATSMSTLTGATLDVVEIASWAAIEQVIGEGRVAQVYGVPPAGVSMPIEGQKVQFPVTCDGKRYLPKGASVLCFLDGGSFANQITIAVRVLETPSGLDSEAYAWDGGQPEALCEHEWIRKLTDEPTDHCGDLN